MPKKKKYLIVAQHGIYSDTAIFWDNAGFWASKPDFKQSGDIKDVLHRCEKMHKGFMIFEDKAAIFALKKMGRLTTYNYLDNIPFAEFLDYAKTSGFIVVENPDGNFLNLVEQKPVFYHINI